MKRVKKIVVVDDVECVMEYWNNKLTFQSKKSTNLNLVNQKGRLIFIPKDRYNQTSSLMKQITLINNNK